jgi:hypothetical protein
MSEETGCTREETELTRCEDDVYEYTQGSRDGMEKIRNA